MTRDGNDETVNLTALTWAHAVNSQAALDAALKSNVDMIEADIVLGKLHGCGANVPVMAHPPAKTSDISLANFLHQIMTHNAAQATQIKGIKLDFKSIEVFEGSLNILNEMIPQMTYPVWLNADIVAGPVNESETVPVNPERFFAGCAPFNKAVLSIGWTTRWGADYTDGEYTNKEIGEMLKAIKRNNITDTKQVITFPVRAGIAANSQTQLHALVRALNETNRSSLTIWSSQNDHVDIVKLRQLIYALGFNRIYLDLPDEIAEKLDLSAAAENQAASASALPTFLNFSLISVCMVLASMWLKRVHL